MIKMECPRCGTYNLGQICSNCGADLSKEQSDPIISTTSTVSSSNRAYPEYQPGQSYGGSPSLPLGGFFMLVAGIAIIIFGMIWLGNYKDRMNKFEMTHDTSNKWGGSAWSISYGDTATFEQMKEVYGDCQFIMLFSAGWAIVVGIMILAAKESFIRTYIWGAAVNTFLIILFYFRHNDEDKEYGLEYLISGKLLANAIIFALLAIIVYHIVTKSQGVQEYMKAHSGRRTYATQTAASYNEPYDPNPSRLAKIAQEKKEEEILRNGGWRCAYCNHLNASYIGTCSCGKTRSQHDEKLRQNELYKEELQKRLEAKENNVTSSNDKQAGASVTNTVTSSSENQADVHTDEKQQNSKTSESQVTADEPVICTADPEGYPMYFLPNGYPYYLNSDNQKYYFCENGRMIYYDENGDAYYPY
ncbi:MAG: hypothetical protein K5750_08970 [Eubacterium sp.]|nr:hypothetical protein [Eubacterium sp.]